MKMNMKKIISWGMMLAAAFTLTNCAKEIDAPVQEPESNGYPFEIVASTVDTKTVNDGIHTNWAAGDQINLFHAVTDMTTYVNDGIFAITAENLETSVFAGTVNGELDLDEEYDWYAFYPYTSQITTPANTTTYVTVGSKTNAVQTQVGNNSMAHIAGPNYPIVGKAYATPANVTPSIDMYHATSLVKVVVTNNTDEPLTVEEIFFVAPEHIVGTYYIDFTADKLTSASFKSSGESYTSNTAKLAVTDGEELAKGESAEFYLAVKPFTAAAGSTLELYVNGAVKEVKLTNDVTFTAGKVKTLNYSYVATEVAGPETLTVAEFLAKDVNAAVWYQLTGTVKNIVNTQYGNFDLVDETGSVYVYGLTQGKQASNNQSFSKLGLKEGDVLTLMGTRAVYNSTAQVGGPAYYVSHVVSSDAPVITCEDNIVTITAADGALIYYTIDGSEPTTASYGYDEPFEIEETTLVKAIALEEGKVVSVATIKTCTFVQEGDDAEPQVVFLETFTGTNGTMGWSGNVANGSTIKYDNAGWTVANAYGASDAIKLGASSKKGSAQTPALNITGNATLKFKAGAWSGDQTTLVLSMTNGTLSQTSVVMKSGDWTEYEVLITGATSGAKITFEGKQASKARFFLDDVQIIQ